MTNSIAILIAAMFGPRIAARLNIKIGHKKVDERLKRIQRKTPDTSIQVKNWNWLYNSHSFILIASIISPLFFIKYLHPALHGIFHKGEFIFYNNGQYLATFVYILLIPLAFNLAFILFASLNKGIKTYYAARNLQDQLYFTQKLKRESLTKLAQKYDMNPVHNQSIKSLTGILIVWILINLPFQALALNSYTQIHEQGVRTSNILELKTRQYSWDEVDRIDIQAKYKGEDITPQILLNFADGKTTNIWDFGLVTRETSTFTGALELADLNQVVIWPSSMPNINHFRENLRKQIQEVFNFNSDPSNFIPEGSLLKQLINGDTF
ncbi:hypothetical protein HOD30_03870 [Candidatus Peregrinibacteria bacterium]|jgi:hypothetical protein|nr:hypothetical protein [Candidatus Peregrinibacteria bacterium]MBT4631712.1 hypothetical protein [Candidatus Peregrinibacteria bacterium]MBT5516564.1 hypothetical protein [Candidatus Peregrinibacteria bacterium]MBT5824556.1 hypothetical protein [Candidatus Peregrinibacteria bacterium]